MERNSGGRICLCDDIAVRRKVNNLLNINWTKTTNGIVEVGNAVGVIASFLKTKKQRRRKKRKKNARTNETMPDDTELCTRIKIIIIGVCYVAVVVVKASILLGFFSCFHLYLITSKIICI